MVWFWFIDYACPKKKNGQLLLGTRPQWVQDWTSTRFCLKNPASSDKEKKFKTKNSDVEGSRPLEKHVLRIFNLFWPVEHQRCEPKPLSVFVCVTCMFCVCLFFHINFWLLQIFCHQLHNLLTDVTHSTTKLNNFSHSFHGVEDLETGAHAGREGK